MSYCKLLVESNNTKPKHPLVVIVLYNLQEAPQLQGKSYILLQIIQSVIKMSTSFPTTKNLEYCKSYKGYIPEEMERQDTALVEALNFSNRFPVLQSILQTIPSAPAV